MRFLKFVALILHFYAQNADGDVKRMFETAYSNLLRDHPDLKSLKKLSNLLESLPSNKEFKSLLGNPKNIKDCGKSVAQSLMILTNCWHKLSNEKNANRKQGAGGGIVATTSAFAVTETTARAGEARVVVASSGDSVVDATSVGIQQLVVVLTVNVWWCQLWKRPFQGCSPRRRRRRNLNLSTYN
ncbi:uncharacterized protein LOC126706550 [Quercus robur]|uniref:uncharacterized protein LOC126706550 n=1 Tax=Quercus robur TaxID=38942 RepID=UPI0021624648|nr:uncharacterized protein LOC126706550 [Quercus robur]